MRTCIQFCVLVAFILSGCKDHEDGLMGSSNADLLGKGTYNAGTGYVDPRGTGDRYNVIEENPFVATVEAPVSTFSVDADGASYANARRFIMNENQLPPKDAIRTEELINYFKLDYPETKSEHPISLNGEVSACPWTPGNKLIRIGIQAHTTPTAELPPSNLVLLIDVSGSMSSNDKLDLLKRGFTLMVPQFTAQDHISIVTYAGSAAVLLQPTPGDQKEKILSAIDKLGAGGSTAGAQGIITAYELAQQSFFQGGNNRVILGTDGDFNVGISNQEELIKLIEQKRDLGIFLTVLGVGRGNLNDGMMEQVANKGNGTYEYIDDLDQARKVFVHEYNKFFPAAKDVKVQVEFNPILVESYRLIGYENRKLEKEDFEDDEKDAGEISDGQNITAIYEIKPMTGAQFRYSPTFAIKFRYKMPNGSISFPLDLEIFDEGNSFEGSSEFMKFSASVAGFGMLLRSSPYKGNLTYDNIFAWTSKPVSNDPLNLWTGFRSLVTKAKELSK